MAYRERATRLQQFHVAPATEQPNSTGWVVLKKKKKKKRGGGGGGGRRTTRDTVTHLKKKKKSLSSWLFVMLILRCVHLLFVCFLFCFVLFF